MFEQSAIEIPTAVLAGLLSFISPCVLPLIPGYLSFISGVSLEDLSSKEKSKEHMMKVVGNTIFFVIGFSLVFVILGASATGIGYLLQKYLHIFNKVAGVVVFIFGLHLVGAFKLNFLNYEKRFHTNKKQMGLLGSVVIGIAFAFGWTPCIGPILGTILTLAAQHDNVTQGVILLLAYSAGLGIPFILTALMFNYLIGAFGFIKKHFRAVELISGGLLMLVGVLIFFDLLARISFYLLEQFPSLQNVG